MSQEAGPEKLRLDKWLWHARVVKTRTLAQKLAASGHVRINGVRVDSPSHLVRIGDVLTIALERTVRVLAVRGIGERRGSASIAQALYDDQSPPPPPRVELGPGLREAGAGRPSKRDRRAIDRLAGEGEDE